MTVETAWFGSLDDRTNGMFREWLRGRYDDVQALNAAWDTPYDDFEDVDPRDWAVFDYQGHNHGAAAHPEAVEDHVAFRSATLREALARQGEIVRAKYPDVLLLAEVPYQYGSTHPHARDFRLSCGTNPEACDYADIVLSRSTAPLTADEVEIMRERQRSLGQRFVLPHRTYGDWDLPRESPGFEPHVRAYADQAAAVGNGCGFYSWNEMGDTHVAYTPEFEESQQWTEDKAERAIELLGAMVGRYREMVAVE